MLWVQILASLSLACVLVYVEVTTCPNIRFTQFLQLINHAIPTELIEKLKEDISRFFKLPLEEKEKCAQIPNNIEGYGPAFTLWEERKLDWGDMLFIKTLPVEERSMRFWPTNPLTFRFD